MENGNGYNAGDPNAGNPNPTGQGDPGAGAPDNQGGTQTDPGNEELTKTRDENKRLNRALVEARRASRQNQPQGGEGDENPFETPSGQYAISIQLATGKLRDGLESRISLYPELPAEDIQRIRMNPWAFAPQDLLFKGDWESALDEIEQIIADRVEALGANPDANKGAPANGTPATPATINNNPAPDAPDNGADPGSTEDENPWTMPMAKLEKLKNKEVAKMSSQPQK